MDKIALRTFPPLASKSRISLKYCPSMMLRRARAWDLQKNIVIVHKSKSHEPDISISVADLWHFGVDPDPRIHASD